MTPPEPTSAALHGWGQVAGSRKYHYCGPDRRSLCGRYAFVGFTQADLYDTWHTHDQNCGACQRRYAALQTDSPDTQSDPGTAPLSPVEPPTDRVRAVDQLIDTLALRIKAGLNYACQEDPTDGSATHLWDRLEAQMRQPDPDLIDVIVRAALVWQRLEQHPGERDPLLAHLQRSLPRESTSPDPAAPRLALPTLE